MRKIPLALVFVSLLSGVMPTASAEIYFDTISNPVNLTLQNLFGPAYTGGGDSFYFAQQFSTGSTGPNTITSLGLSLAQDPNIPTTGTYAVSIWSVAAGVPNTLVASVGSKDASLLPNIPTSPPFVAPTTLFTGLNISLSANTDYMVVVDPANLGPNWMFWYRAMSNYQGTYDNPESPFYAGSSYSPATAYWQFEQWNTAAEPFYMQINVVPEPSTYCMALAGLACGGSLVRRRRKRANLSSLTA